MASKKALCTDTVTWVRYHLGKDCFAPLTGGDWPAWHAFVHLVQCYANGGGDKAIDAMRSVVACAQQTEAVLRVFVQAIPAVMDWGDVRRLWPLIADQDNGSATIKAIERISSESILTRKHGWDGPVDYVSVPR